MNKKPTGARQVEQVCKGKAGAGCNEQHLSGLARLVLLDRGSAPVLAILAPGTLVNRSPPYLLASLGASAGEFPEQFLVRPLAYIVWLGFKIRFLR